MNTEYKITEMLLPFRLTWKNRATADLIHAIELVAEDADRICAVQKEVYAAIAEARCCTWRGVESNIRRAGECAAASLLIIDHAGWMFYGVEGRLLVGELKTCRFPKVGKDSIMRSMTPAVRLTKRRE